MNVLPNLTVTCEDMFREETTAIALKTCLGDWKPEFETLFIVDESWGYAYEVLVKPEYLVTVVITQCPTPEYWDVLLSLNPSVLLAGKQTLERAIQALKAARPDTNLSFMPQHERVLTLTESKVLRQLAMGKTNRGISEELQIKEQSVANHIHNVYLKLGVPNRAEALLYYWGVGGAKHRAR
jgi:DNA-binding CsgD family transcriptional regulator